MADSGEYVDYWNLELEEGVSEAEIEKIAIKLVATAGESLYGH